MVLLVAIRAVAPRLARQPLIAEASRARQRRTALALLATTLRYVVVVAALLGVLAVLAGGGSLAALGGGAFLAVVLGFAFQRLLYDMIAGFFILFEGQYAVGDRIRLEPSGATGVVQEVGLRATVVRGDDGETAYVPNGAITAAKRLPDHSPPLRVELLTRDVAALEERLGDVGPMLGLVGASLQRVAREPIAPDLGCLRLTVSAPRPEPLRELVAGPLAARGGDLIVGMPLVVAEEG